MASSTALFYNQASYNAAHGYAALANNSTGSSNTASGYTSLYENTTGDGNSAFGRASLYLNTTGERNTAMGYYAAYSNTTGNRNTALGYQSLYNITTGGNNTALGYRAYAGAANATNQTVIGYETTGQADNSVVLGNDDVTAVYMGEDSGAIVYTAGLRTPSNSVLTLSGDDATFADDLTVNGDVNISSDLRLKSNIVSLGSTISKLLLIDGKSYIMDKDGKQKIGVLAQEVKAVFPELVGKDIKGMLTVNYQGLVPVLINALNEQESKINDQQKQIDELKEMVKKLMN